MKEKEKDFLNNRTSLTGVQIPPPAPLDEPRTFFIWFGEIAKERYDHAVDHLKKAWKHAQKALKHTH